ncbi:uncharacterized protein L201_006990 [Kwoniella dendrophila CBS 6074]|uniref:BRCT domain-containing protein n=1 Tax=Kwoniella dendrophila CBS 6074 TaxID=1295534 RepID=A0AAX4K2W0_9TREE
MSSSNRGSSSSTRYTSSSTNNYLDNEVEDDQVFFDLLFFGESFWVVGTPQAVQEMNADIEKNGGTISKSINLATRVIFLKPDDFSQCLKGINELTAMVNSHKSDGKGIPLAEGWIRDCTIRQEPVETKPYLVNDKNMFDGKFWNKIGKGKEKPSLVGKKRRSKRLKTVHFPPTPETSKTVLSPTRTEDRPELNPTSHEAHPQPNLDEKIIADPRSQKIVYPPSPLSIPSRTAAMNGNGEDSFYKSQTAPTRVSTHIYPITPVASPSTSNSAATQVSIHLSPAVEQPLYERHFPTGFDHPGSSSNLHISDLKQLNAPQPLPTAESHATSNSYRNQEERFSQQAAPSASFINVGTISQRNEQCTNISSSSQLRDWSAEPSTTCIDPQLLAPTAEHSQYNSNDKLSHQSQPLISTDNVITDHQPITNQVLECEYPSTLEVAHEKKDKTHDPDYQEEEKPVKVKSESKSAQYNRKYRNQTTVQPQDQQAYNALVADLKSKVAGGGFPKGGMKAYMIKRGIHSLYTKYGTLIRAEVPGLPHSRENFTKMAQGGNARWQKFIEEQNAEQEK